MIRSLYVVLALLVGTSAFAKTKQFCGKREGTAGNAVLVDNKGNEVVTIAVQGQGDVLLEQADDLIGKNSGVKGQEGMQNGKKYCIVAEVNEAGEPVKITKAWHKK